MKLLVWPLFLCYDYSMDAVPLVESLTDIRLLLPVATYLVFFQVCTAALRRLALCGREQRLVQRRVAEGLALSIAIFALSFLPMTNILFPIGTLVAERLLYLPSLGFISAAVSLAYLETITSSGILRRPLRSISTRALLFITTVFWAWLCYKRVLDWSTVQSITYTDGLKQLKSSRTQFNLANIYLLENRHEEALLAYQRSIAADPQERDSQPLYHAGQILMYHQKYAEAETYLQKAVGGYFSPLVMQEEEVWHDYGLALWHAGKGAEAIQNLQNALITNPEFPKGYNNLACALVMMGISLQPPNTQLVQDGLKAIERAVGLVPAMPLYWRNAAALLSLAGDVEGGRNAWNQYRQLDPASAVSIEATGQMPEDCVWEFYFR
jgi:tetratricopeptide (TPR) repeat protein